MIGHKTPPPARKTAKAVTIQALVPANGPTCNSKRKWMCSSSMKTKKRTSCCPISTIQTPSNCKRWNTASSATPNSIFSAPNHTIAGSAANPYVIVVRALNVD